MRDPHLYPALSIRSLLLLVPAIIPSVITSMLGALLTAQALVTWYPTLAKPWFTPPNIAFPIAWTFLFALMALAFWRVLRARPEAGSKLPAIAAHLGQLIVNVAWSYAFFARQSPWVGMVVVVLLFLAILMTMRTFIALDRPAGFALLPYLAWVAFAAMLNGAIALANPG